MEHSVVLLDYSGFLASVALVCLTGKSNHDVQSFLIPCTESAMLLIRLHRLKQPEFSIFQTAGHASCKLLADRAAQTLLATREPALYDGLCGKFGEPSVRRAEKRWTLLAIDNCWSDHLEYAAQVRETFHLESLGVDKPLDVYHRVIIGAFADFFRQVEERVVQAGLSVDLEKPLLELETAALRIPSATWTYLINDQFFSDRSALW